MPARRAHSPRRRPFHLPRLARRCFAPNRKVGFIALAVDFIDPCLSIFGDGASKATIFWNGRDIEIQATVECIAMLVGDGLAPCDHGVDIFRRFGVGWLADVEPFQISFKIRLVKSGDIPCGLALCGRRFFHLVVTRVRVTGQMADIGDVDDMGKLIALIREHTAKRVGKDISAHIADMLVIIHRRPAAIHPGFAFMHRGEGFQLPGQAVEEFKFGHGWFLALPNWNRQHSP